MDAGEGDEGRAAEPDEHSDETSNDDDPTEAPSTPASIEGAGDDPDLAEPETPDADTSDAEASDAGTAEHVVAVVETAAVPIKPKKRSLYGGRFQRRSPGQSSPSDR